MITTFLFIFLFLEEALRHVTKYISSNSQSISKILPYDENSVVNKISNHLSTKSQSKAQIFMNMHEQMSTCVSFFSLKNNFY